MFEGRLTIKPPTLEPNFSAIKVAAAIHIPDTMKEAMTFINKMSMISEVQTSDLNLSLKLVQKFFLRKMQFRRHYHALREVFKLALFS